MKVLLPPLAEYVQQIFKDAHELYIVSPWIKYQLLVWILSSNNHINPNNIHVLISGNLDDFIVGSTDLETIEWLLEFEADLRSLANLHAKIYLADDNQVILTSANLTPSGLGTCTQNNLEIGILIDNIEYVLEVKKIIKRWFDRGNVITKEWLKKAKHNIQQYESQQNEKKRKEIENNQQRINQNLKNKSFKIKKYNISKSPQIKNSFIGDNSFSELKALLSKIFQNREECEAGISYFSKAISFIPSSQDIRHILSITSGKHKRKLTLNIGNWEIFSLTRRKYGLQAIFCVDFSLLTADMNSTDNIKISKLSSRWSGGGSFGFIKLPWNYQTFQLSKVSKAWQSAIQHAVKIFGHWKASTFMKYHHQDLFNLIIDKDYRETAFFQIYGKEFFDENDKVRSVLN